MGGGGVAGSSLIVSRERVKGGWRGTVNCVGCSDDTSSQVA